MKRIDCDIFMKPGSSLDLFDKVIYISGNFYGGKDCCVTTAIIAGEDVIFEDNADTVGIYAGGRVSIGKFSKTLSISSNKDVFLDDFSYANHIFAKEDVTLGYETCALSIVTDGNILLSYHDKPKTFFSKLIQKIENFFFRI